VIDEPTAPQNLELGQVDLIKTEDLSDRWPQGADSATLSFYATKDGKISVSFQGWDASKTVLDG
jgi:hypothetical protein